MYVILGTNFVCNHVSLKGSNCATKINSLHDDVGLYIDSHVYINSHACPDVGL